MPRIRIWGIRKKSSPRWTRLRRTSTGVQGIHNALKTLDSGWSLSASGGPEWRKKTIFEFLRDHQNLFGTLPVSCFSEEMWIPASPSFMSASNAIPLQIRTSVNSLNLLWNITKNDRYIRKLSKPHLVSLSCVVTIWNACVFCEMPWHVSCLT